MHPMVDLERDAVLDALSRNQTSGIATTAERFDLSERSRHREVLL